MNELLNRLSRAVKEPVLENEPMSRHITFKVGGPAKYYVRVSDSAELARVFEICLSEGTQYYVIGNGSNLLVRDEGYDGVIIEIGRSMGDIKIEGTVLTAGAGASLAAIAAAARDAGLSGLEFAAGIPGTAGGACVMNAGAYGGEIKQVLKKVKLMDKNGRLIDEDASGISLSYRHSNIPDRSLTVVEAEFELSPSDPEEITARIRDLNARRAEKQPLEYPSAGSTFKRPEGYFAGKLIEDAGMKGYTVGGAQVSEKHAGFVINKGGATAADIWNLTCDVREAVLKTSGVILEREIRLI